MIDRLRDTTHRRLTMLRDGSRRRIARIRNPERQAVFANRLRAIPPRRLAALALRALVVLALLVVLVTSSEGEKEESRPAAEAGAQAGGERRTSFLARIVPPAADSAARKNAPVPRSVAELARRLPLERKVAQMFLLGFRGQDLNAPIFRRLRRLDVGGIVVGADNYINAPQLASLAGEARVIAAQERQVPPLVMAAQEGGDFNVFGDLPPPTAASDLPSAARAAAEARESGTTLRPLGVRGVLAPVLDVGLADDPAIGPRAFSDDPETVAKYARAVVKAYRSARIFAAPKHFPGIGTASQSTEVGPANVGLSIEELRARDLIPFRAAIRAGVPAIVVSHALYAPDDFVTPATLSRAITTGLLRDELGFTGVAVTDDLADPPITALTTVPEAAVRAVRAGADLLYISGSPADQQASYVAVLQAVRRGEIARAKINQSVLRILAGKRDYGLIG